MNYVIHLFNNMVSNSVTKYVFMSLEHNAGHKCQKTMIAGKSFDTAVKFRYLGMAPTNHNCMHTDIMSNWNLGNVSYHLFQKLLCSHFLLENIKIKKAILWCCMLPCTLLYNLHHKTNETLLESNTQLSTICLIHILAFLGDNQQV